MSKSLPKTLDLGLSNFGGGTHFYARNVIRSGDWASVARIIGDYVKQNEVLIELYKEFNTPAYLEQMKQHLLAINPALKFANDQPKGNFISVDDVLRVCLKNRKLMSFEIEAIKNRPEQIHRLYLKAKPKKLLELPSEYNYEFNNGLYPIMDVHNALTEIIHGI